MFAARIVPRTLSASAGAARRAAVAAPFQGTKLQNYARTYAQQTKKASVAAPKAGTVATKPNWRQELTTLQSGMPQLVPFFFVNEALFTMATLGVVIYTTSKFILPRVLRMKTARQFLTKL